MTIGLAAAAANAPLLPISFERRALGPHDVGIDILYCGVCHSDLHMVRGEWSIARFPCVPGHEIVGRIATLGKAVDAYTVGDIVGVGCMIDSCRQCDPCQRGEEQFCVEEFTSTYGSPDRTTGEITLGGYATDIVVDSAFVLPISHPPDKLAGVAPLLCAGVTAWSALREWRIGPGRHFGVIGLGGVGHVAVKLAKALGARVTVFTSSPAKRAAAFALGADAVVITSDTEAMARCVPDLDMILDTVSAPHDLEPFLRVLAIDGTLVMVGLPSEPALSISVYDLIFSRRRLAGSHIGSIAETRAMLAFCALHGVVADVELVGLSEVTAAFDRMEKGDVKYRFVIDVGVEAVNPGRGFERG